MARSLRTRPRLNRTILSLTKVATSFVYAASCNNNTASLTDFYFPSLVPVVIIHRFRATFPVLSPHGDWLPIGCSNVLFAQGTV